MELNPAMAMCLVLNSLMGVVTINKGLWVLRMVNYVNVIMH